MQAGFSTLDQVFHFVQPTTKFFSGGWGKPENLSRLYQMRRFILDKENCNSVLRENNPEIHIKKEASDANFELYTGHFSSPFAQRFPDLVEEPVSTARFQIVMPTRWRQASNKILKPMCIQLAGTGDHFFWRRRILMAKPLAKHSNVGSILLENPYYGLRKPSYQKRSSLYNVTDLFVMGGCLILESMVLLDWCEKEGFGPLALTGISMGGHMCSLAACNYSKPVALVPCLSWTTASCVFTQGVMSSRVAWQSLKNQYFSDQFRKNESLILSALRLDIKIVAMDLVKNYPISGKDEMESVEKAYLTKLKDLIELFQYYFWLTRKTDSQAHLDSEVMDFLRQVLDEFTHLSKFAKPVDPSLVVVVCAANDAYVPRDKVTGVTDIWPEAQIRYLKNHGHVGAFLFAKDAFRNAIVDALSTTAEKYYGTTEGIMKPQKTKKSS